MLYILCLHIGCAFLSLFLLLIRGIMQLNGKNWRMVKLLKILPHLADTLLIISGLWLFFYFGFDWQSWIIGKLILLVLYVVFAAKALGKKAGNASPLFFILACLSFCGAILIAYLH